MSRYLLDTNICIGLLKGKEKKLLEQLKKLNPENVYLCSIIKAELIYGAKKSIYREKNEKKLQIFLAEFESLPFDDRCAETYGIIRNYLEAAGTPIGANDLLIAAIAVTYNLELITRNVREFSRVSGVKIIEW